MAYLWMCTNVMIAHADFEILMGQSNLLFTALRRQELLSLVLEHKKLDKESREDHDVVCKQQQVKCKVGVKHRKLL